MVGPSRPTILSAATSHADSDTTRTMNELRMPEVTRRMTSHARARLAATESK